MGKPRKEHPIDQQQQGNDDSHFFVPGKIKS
jgi:hypothetical protein